MKKKDKSIGIAVAIAIFIVFVLCAVMMVVGSALGLFKGGGTVFDPDTWQKEEPVATAVTETEKADVSEPSGSLAKTLEETMCSDGIAFECDSQKEVGMQEVLAGEEIASYSIGDMTGDGVKDLILKTKSDKTVVLMETSNGVYVKTFAAGTFIDPSTKGVFMEEKSMDVNTYSRLQLIDNGCDKVNVATEKDSTFMIDRDGNAELTEVSREEYILFINKNCGTVLYGFKEYSEEELKKDLTNPIGFTLTKAADLDETYWGVIIPELQQYNDMIGASYSKFAKKEGDVYQSSGSWTKGAKELLHCLEKDGAEYVGTDYSMYKAEYIGYLEDAMIMSGAQMDTTNPDDLYLVRDFLVDEDISVTPAIFDVDEQNDALVWSCGDTYLIVFATKDSRQAAFYDRTAAAVCYVMKGFSDIKSFEQVLN